MDLKNIGREFCPGTCLQFRNRKNGGMQLVEVNGGRGRKGQKEQGPSDRPPATAEEKRLSSQVGDRQINPRPTRGRKTAYF